MNHLEDWEDNVVAVTKIDKKLIVLFDNNSKELKFNTEEDTMQMYEYLKEKIKESRSK